jgi:ParB family chromosome partitioning protein
MTTGHGIQSLIPPKKGAEIIEEKKELSTQSHPPVFNIHEKDEKKWSDKDTPHEKQRSDTKPDSIFHIEIEKIKPNPYQPRKVFHKEDLDELAQSISEFGIIQPLLVSKVIKEKDGGADVEYQLIAGERRLMAAKIAGLERVPAIVKKIDTGKAKLEIALIENIQRSNLNAFESAKAYARLQDEFGLTQREIAVRVGKSREVVANTLRLLNLPSHMQSALTEGKINESQARALLSISSITEQQKTFDRLIQEKTTARQIRERVASRQIQAKNPEELTLERQLEEKLGAPVKIIKNQGKGRIVIEFYSQEEWQSIIGALMGNEFD